MEYSNACNDDIWTNVIPITYWKKIQDKINNIVEHKWYNWSKNDLIGALLSQWTLDVDWDSVDYLYEEEYSFLYDRLIEFVESVWEKTFFHLWYTFKYNKEEKIIYFIDNSTIKLNKSSYKLDINLIVSEDYSDTTIEISHDNNIILVLSNGEYGLTWYIPWQQDDLIDIDDEEFLSEIWEKEKSHIENMKIDRNNLMWAISSNFWDLIVSSWEQIGSLWIYWTYLLLSLLTEMIIEKFWEEYDLIVEPFSNLYIQMIVENSEKSFLKNLSYKFEVDPKTFQTTILLHEEDKVLFKIEKWNIKVC